MALAYVPVQKGKHVRVWFALNGLSPLEDPTLDGYMIPDSVSFNRSTEVVKKKTTSTPAPEKKAAVPAPLSTEKAALESAKSAYTTAMKPLSDAKSQVSSASSAYTKATSARESAQKKSTDLKKKLSNANDSLAKAKKNGKPSQITDVYVKEIANIKVCFVYI